jgi:hypothetical protein
MDERGQEPRELFTGGEALDDDSHAFSWNRWCWGTMGGGVGLVLGVLLGLFGGGALDEANGFPLGRSSGFLRVGHLTCLCVVAGTLLGALLGALAAHKLAGGRGRFWGALLGVLVGVALVAGVSLPGRGLVFPALLLLPVAAALGLEFSTSRE